MFRLSSLSVGEESIEGKHLVVLCKISFGNRTVATYALIDCRATGIAFIDEDFTCHHQLLLTPLQYSRSLEVIDGCPISSGDITHVANTHLAILEHQETLPMFVTKLGHYPVVIGIPWLELHDVAIRFSSQTLTFGSQYCTSHRNQAPTVVHTHSLASKIAHEEPVVCAGAGEFEARSFTSPNSSFQNQVNHGKDYNLGMGTRSSNWRARPNETSVFLDSSILNRTSAGSTIPTPNTDEPTFPTPDTDGPMFLTTATTERPIQISAIGGHPFRRLAYKQKLTIFSIPCMRSIKHSAWVSKQKNRRSWI